MALPQQFAIAFGQTVSDGVPAPGAGNDVDDFDTYAFALSEVVTPTWHLFLPAAPAARQPQQP